MNIKYKDRDIFCEVIYKERRNLTIRVAPPNRVFLIAPLKMTEKELKKIAESKVEWIVKKLNEFSDVDLSKINKQYIDGEKFLYLGAEYPLKIFFDVQVEKPVLIYEDDIFCMKTATMESLFLKNAFINWYKAEAQIIIEQRIRYFQKFFDVEPAKVKVKEQKKRWGSCTSQKQLYFNWRCVMAPLEVIDYLVVHEMCHLVQMNHSSQFWGLVEAIMPDYEKRRYWLKKHGFELALELDENGEFQ